MSPRILAVACLLGPALVAGCAESTPPPAASAAAAVSGSETLDQARTAETAADIAAARLAVAEALTEARALRARLLEDAMAAPAGSPLAPTLADRAERLKRMEDDLAAAQADLQAARAPDTPAEVARRSVRQAQAAAQRLSAMTAGMR
jgi:hypothetical protein